MEYRALNPARSGLWWRRIGHMSFAYGNATSDDWNASTALTEPTSGLVPDIPILGL